MPYIEYLPIIVTALVTSCLLVVMTPMAHYFGLVDSPSLRKQHSGHVPLTGGLAMFMGIVLASFVTDLVFQNEPMFFTAAAFIVLLGMLDDKFNLSAKGRLFFQFVVAFIMVWVANNYIVNLGDLFGTGNIQIPSVGYLFTMICVVGVINAFNMIDGIDGLAGGMSLLVLFGVVFLMLYSGNGVQITEPLTIMAAIVPFLAFNLSVKGFKGNKIFLGDAGSMFIGLAIVWMLVEQTSGSESSLRPMTAVWIIGLPLMDMAAIMFRRARKGQSVLKPDRQHLHNIFLRAGFSERRSLATILMLGSVFVLIGVLSEVYQLPESLMFYGFLVVFVLYTAVIMHVWRILRILKRFGLL
ncbi:UDP-N-acetylglucosamine--undecaprenyl-phosphate N-acetylglucosaminephosphotransferase [Glaciecola sp. KUL10]|uniref:UDP-N-acetylglucosamine--undecaprenyl-phosphate N-acetylglucosaminephosphotransferase n=1 Tax=Glaciecola sp. (strain KUL10) TaxID=2161813 RepID=UPI000D786514|nr:UDP-N-acetylglucosamine--undecaprenyl-phosphate N-acetylglucosaminephosphotransferase [Glaciecola sp. KUL10]GBL04191.1 UDP-phosphate alpha-N-acetylglucosaminyl 1-phosphate transferase [Glaciecola sp. KUL10]